MFRYQKGKRQKLIFRVWRVDKKGERLDARLFGYKAWPIWIDA